MGYGTVEKPLTVDPFRYMTVRMQSGLVSVLPSPSLLGLQAQFSSNIGDQVEVASVGTLEQVTYGILMNKGQQFGTPVTYDGTVGPVIFIGNQDDGFARGNMHTEKRDKQNYIEILLPTLLNIMVKYSDAMGGAAKRAALANFRGYVLFNPDGEGSYKMWFQLTRENIESLVLERGRMLMEIAERNLQHGVFDFFANAQNITHLEDLLKRTEPCTAAPAQDVEIFHLKVYGPGDQGHFMIDLPIGSYSPSMLLERAAEQKLSTAGQDILAGYQTHLDTQGLFRLGNAKSHPIAANAKRKLEGAGSVYALRMHDVVVEDRIIELETETIVPAPVRISEPVPVTTVAPKRQTHVQSIRAGAGGG